MTGINHKQAQRYLRAAADGLIRDNQRALLDAHLRGCASCRAEADELNALEARLKKNFQVRWDANDGPSTNVMTTIQSRSRRIIMTNRINTGLKTFAGIAALLVLGLIFNSIIRQVQNSSTKLSASTPTTTVQQFPSIVTDKSNGEWIAFIGSKLVPGKDDPTALSETFNVYMIHPDGTGLVNITNYEDYSGYSFVNLQWSPNGEHFAFLRTLDYKEIMGANQDGSYVIAEINFDDTDIPSSPVYGWSPNGQQIAFVDSRDGNYNIYTVYADGRNDPQLTQLTNDPAQDVGFVWSPDGSRIAYQRLDGDKLSVYIMNADGSNQREVAQGAGQVNLRWSLDGTSMYVSSRDSSWLDCNTCVHKPGIYRIYLNGTVQVHQIHYEQDASKVDGWYLYDTPQNSLYFARIAQSAFLNFRGTWLLADGNSVNELGDTDPHQTCKTTTGNILGEHISPNERYSVITDFCAGGFDLYLADREAATPEQKLVHLIRLPLYIIGGGGDGSYLPIRWSPDGRWLAYDDGIGDTFLLNIEGIIQNPTTKPSLLKLYPNQQEPTGVIDFSLGNLTVFNFDLAWQPRP